MQRIQLAPDSVIAMHQLPDELVLHLLQFLDLQTRLTAANR